MRVWEPFPDKLERKFKKTLTLHPWAYLDHGHQKMYGQNHFLDMIYVGVCIDIDFVVLWCFDCGAK